MVVHHVISVLGRCRQADLWGWLSSQSSWISKFQASERHDLKRQNNTNHCQPKLWWTASSRTTLFWPPNTSVCIHMHSLHTLKHEHTYRHNQNYVKVSSRDGSLWFSRLPGLCSLWYRRETTLNIKGPHKQNILSLKERRRNNLRWARCTTPSLQ